MGINQLNYHTCPSLPFPEITMLITEIEAMGVHRVVYSFKSIDHSMYVSGFHGFSC